MSLLAARDRLVKAEQRRKQQAAEARHKQEMEALAGREAATWIEVERLLESYQSKAYDSAVALLTHCMNWQFTEGRKPLSNCELTRSRQSMPGGRA